MTKLYDPDLLKRSTPGEDFKAVGSVVGIVLGVIAVVGLLLYSLLG